MKLKLILSLTVAGVMVLGGISFAAGFRDDSGNPLDTPAGYIITQEAGTLDFSDNQGNPKPRVINTTHETTVVAVYGAQTVVLPEERDGGLPNPYYINTSPGIPVSWTGFLTNEGNTDLDLRVTLEAFGDSSGFVYTGGADNWDAYFVFDGSNEGGTLESTIDDNTDAVIEFVIWPATAESDSPQASTGTIRFYFDAYGALGTDYTGANYLKYGGLTEATDRFRAKIFAPLMLLTREAFVDSPTTYTQGGSHEAVPGAVITYTIEYNNTGNGTGESIVIVSKVPNNTNAVHVNASTTEVSNVNINPAKSTATGWTVFYSIESAPDKAYGSYTDWTMLGTIESGSDVWINPTLPLLTTTYLKFEKAAVEPAENATLTFGVAVR